MSQRNTQQFRKSDNVIQCLERGLNEPESDNCVIVSDGELLTSASSLFANTKWLISKSRPYNSYKRHGFCNV